MAPSLPTSPLAATTDTPIGDPLMNITEPLRLAVGSHSKGSGKGCAMNVLSWENGDTEITDTPDCADPFLARVVQRVNDNHCTHRTGDLLCPACSIEVLDLMHRTAGTAYHGLDDDALRRVWVTIAVEEAERVLPIFEKAHPGDDRPRKAVQATRRWLNGGPVLDAAAYAAANDAANAAANAAAYAAAYAAAQAVNAAAYAVNAARAAASAASVVTNDDLLTNAHMVIDRFLELAPPVEPWEPVLDRDTAVLAMTRGGVAE